MNKPSFEPVAWVLVGIGAALFLYALLFMTEAEAGFFDSPEYCVERGDGLCWFKMKIGVPTTSTRWIVDATGETARRCGYGWEYEQASCMLSRNKETGECVIVSVFTEEEAKLRFVGSRTNAVITVWQHERMHCDDGGWLHAESVTYSMTARR